MITLVLELLIELLDLVIYYYIIIKFISYFIYFKNKYLI